MPPISNSWSSKFRALFYSPLVITAVALALRLVVMRFYYRMHLNPEHDYFFFGAEVGRVGRSLVRGEGFSSPFPDPTGPTAFVPPAYPVLVAAIFKIFGIYTAASAIAIVTMQSLFSSLTCLPIFLIARRVFSLRVAAWAGWVWAFYPYCFYVTDMAIWETTLTTLLMALLVWVTLQLEDSTNYFAWAGYGLLWGLAALSSPSVLAPMSFLFGWLWLKHRRRGSNCIPAAAAASLAFVAAVAPWMWRTSKLYGRFVPFRSGFGIQILVGNSSDTSLPLNIREIPSGSQFELNELRRMGEPAYMAEKQREAFAFISEHPLLYAKLCLRRILNTWTAFWSYPAPWTLDGVGWPHILTYSFISLLAFIGLGLALKNGLEGAVPLALVVLTYPITYYLTTPAMRYRHPIDPVVTLFFAYGGTYLWLRKSEPHAKEEKLAGLAEIAAD